MRKEKMNKRKKKWWKKWKKKIKKWIWKAKKYIRLYNKKQLLTGKDNKIKDKNYIQMKIKDINYKILSNSK